MIGPTVAACLLFNLTVTNKAVVAATEKLNPLYSIGETDFTLLSGSKRDSLSDNYGGRAACRSVGCANTKHEAISKEVVQFIGPISWVVMPCIPYSLPILRQHVGVYNASRFSSLVLKEQFVKCDVALTTHYIKNSHANMDVECGRSANITAFDGDFCYQKAILN